MTMLRVRDMTVRFGGIVALDGVSLDLNRGEILGLIGPNGAGKTTLFNCISGVISPDHGAMFFEGHSLNYAPPHVRARFGMARTFQNLQLWSSMTVAASLVLPVCDYVYVLDFGKLLARGQPAAIRSDPKVIAAYLGEESKKLEGEVATVVPTSRPQQAQAPLLEVKQLAAGYGGLEVIRDVSLEVRPGEVVACIGP